MTMANIATIAQIESELAALATLPQMTEAYYAAAHQRFEAASNQQQLLLQWFTEGLLATLPTNQRAAMLSVGCGSGFFDRPLVNQLKRKWPQVSYVGVDPSEPSCKTFAEGFRNEDKENVRVEVHALPFDAYTTQNRFDVIHFVQSIYYLPDPAAALTKAVGLLRKDGKVVVAVAPAEALNQVAARLWEKQWGRPAWFAQEVQAALDATGASYSVDVLEARLDVTTCLDQTSESGRQILDFMAQAKTHDLPVSLQTALLSYVRGIATDRGEGLFTAPHPVWMITIRPPATREKQAP